MINEFIVIVLFCLAGLYFFLEWYYKKQVTKLVQGYDPTIDMSRKENHNLPEYIPEKIELIGEEARGEVFIDKEPTILEPKPKRNRRTPAQMAEARALENPPKVEDKPILSDSEVL